MKRPIRFLTGLAAFALTATALGAPPASAAPGADFETSAQSTAPAGTRSFGILGDGTLVTFALNNPRNVNRFGTLTGFTGGDTEIVGMDIRPSNGRLYAIGDAGGVYIVQLRTTELTPVGQIEAGDGALEGTQFGVDFNPAADALRIVSDTGQNLRVTFSGRDVASTIEDGDLNDGMANPVTGVTAAAYTNNDNSDITGTTLLDINTAQNNLAFQAPANAGSLSNAGSLRIGVGPDASFDIFSALGNRGVARDNAGYAVMSQNGNRILFSINLTTGEASRIGRFPAGSQVTDMAIQLP